MRVVVQARRAARQPAWRGIGYGLLLALPILLFLVSLTLGLYGIDVSDVGRILLSPLWPNLADDIPDAAQTIVLQIRLPRVLAALLIGATLACTGTAFQGIFKNPLVDSNLLGVSSGAGFGAALMLLIKAGTLQVQLAAFAFGLLAVSLAFFGSRMY
ncbi:MAG: iron chelate uptake ABC transporter family permease subunit, partial [Phototrophicaceae bacterium]